MARVSVGDHVNKYDPIAEVMTDKVNAEVPSSFTGTITELVGEEGETLQVGEVICEVEYKRKQRSRRKRLHQSKGSSLNQTEDKRESKSKETLFPGSAETCRRAQHRFGAVQGTGAGGRITRKDF